MRYSLKSEFIPRTTIKRTTNNTKIQRAVHISDICRLSDAFNVQSEKFLNKSENKKYKLEEQTNLRYSEPFFPQTISEYPELHKAKQRSRLFSQKIKLKPDFAYCLKTQNSSKGNESHLQANLKQKQWFFRARAKMECLRIYEQQNQSVKKQLACLNRIKGRLKVLKQIKKQKIRLLNLLYDRKQ